LTGKNFLSKKLDRKKLPVKYLSIFLIKTNVLLVCLLIYLLIFEYFTGKIHQEV